MGHVVVLFSGFEELPRLISSVAVLVCTPVSSVQTVCHIHASNVLLDGPV